MSVLQTAEILTFDEIKKAISKFLVNLSEDHFEKDSDFLRLEFRCNDIDPVIWLHNQKTDIKTYWSDRETDFVLGGIDTVNIIQGKSNIDYADLFKSCRSGLPSNASNLRYYGGIRFSNQKQEPEWSLYGAYRFVLPRFELFQTQGKTIFAVNIARKDVLENRISDYTDRLGTIDFSLATQYKKVPKVLTRTDTPTEEEWLSLCRKVLAEKINNLVQKVVLARKSIFTFNVLINPIALVKHLKDMTPDCFHFCFQVGESEGFLGATPECLYKYKSGQIETEAIAGTTSRGTSSAEDQQLAQTLLGSGKDIREHNFVVEDIKRSLDKICSTVYADPEFTLMKLKGSQHLQTKITGQKDPSAKEADILRSLHPTPAVAGTPTKLSLELINKLENFDRGWYAGPIGYIGRSESGFAVGIRSGLVSQQSLSLYAGAGIVEGSQPESEWSEIENKISRFIKVFDI